MTQPTRILVIDDEPQIQRFLRPSLIATGYEVIAASSGTEGLRRAASEIGRAHV